MSNTRETISLKTIIMTQNMTKRQGKRKGKDTCDAFFPLSLNEIFEYEQHHHIKDHKDKEVDVMD